MKQNAIENKNLDKEKKFEAIKAVYSYFFPEVRDLVFFEKNIPYDFFLNTTNYEQGQKTINSLFKEPFEIPRTIDDRIDLDSIHEPIIKKIKGAYKNHADLDVFEYSYPMAGSSQGIFHLLAEQKAKGVERIYVLSGEYEGYQEYGRTLGIETTQIDIADVKKQNGCKKFNELEKGLFFISNPSARDGNIISNETINKICEAGHKVVLDFAYIGMTKKHKFQTQHKNIIAATMSFSKPYGVFRFRIGGFTFSKEPLQSLYANKWFKDVPALLSAAKIVEEIPPRSLYEKYSKIQKEIILKLRKDFQIPFFASDSFLLAHLKEEDARKLNKSQLEMIANFKRGDNYRFCLTHYFEKYELNEL